MASKRITRNEQGQAPETGFRRTEQEKQIVRQLAAGLDREGADLENERRQLLEDRRRYFGQHEQEHNDGIPSPKFNEPASHPSHRNRAPGSTKLHQLEELLDQIVRDSSKENVDVQRGLNNLRLAHQRVIRDLNGGERARPTHSRKPSNTAG